MEMQAGMQDYAIELGNIIDRATPLLLAYVRHLEHHLNQILAARWSA